MSIATAVKVSSLLLIVSCSTIPTTPLVFDDVWQAQKTQEIFWTLVDNPSKTNFDPFFPPHTPEELKLQIIQNAIRLHYETIQESLPSSTTGF